VSVTLLPSKSYNQYNPREINLNISAIKVQGKRVYYVYLHIYDCVYTYVYIHLNTYMYEVMHCGLNTFHPKKLFF
jgi:hypothetical protein